MLIYGNLFVGVLLRVAFNCWFVCFLWGVPVGFTLIVLGCLFYLFGAFDCCNFGSGLLFVGVGLGLGLFVAFGFLLFGFAFWALIVNWLLPVLELACFTCIVLDCCTC